MAFIYFSKCTREWCCSVSGQRPERSALPQSSANATSHEWKEKEDHESKSTASAAGRLAVHLKNRRAAFDSEDIIDAGNAVQQHNSINDCRNVAAAHLNKHRYWNVATWSRTS